MRRGFKAEAERIAVDVRKQLGLGIHDRMDPWAYAALIGVLVLEFAELDISAASALQLTKTDSDSWSGMTIKEGSVTAIVINPAHQLARSRNTLMHELSHIMLKHVPNSVQVSPTGLMLLSDYSDDQEAEADWLAAAILIPRDALMQLRMKGKTREDISEVFGVSDPLCEWRLRTTGVEIQMRRRSR